MHIGGCFFGTKADVWFRSLVWTLFLFVLGSSLGSMYCVMMPQTTQNALCESLNGQAGILTIRDSARVFRSSFFNYAQLWILLCLCATSRLGIVCAPLLLGVRGFVGGFAVATLIVLYGLRGLGAAAVGILPAMLLLLPAMQVLCAAAVRHVIAQAQETERARRRHRFLSYCLLCMILLAVFVLAALYEGYVGWILISKCLV